jgi:hypothetical protein
MVQPRGGKTRRFKLFPLLCSLRPRIEANVVSDRKGAPTGRTSYSCRGDEEANRMFTIGSHSWPEKV